MVELHFIYQKWGLQSVVVAMTAMEHVFAQDPKKRAFVAQAMMLVDELRKKLKKSDADSTTKMSSTTDKQMEITREMIFDRIKETQILMERHAVSAVDTYEKEYAIETDTSKRGQIASFLADARKKLNDARDSLMKGQGGYVEQDFKDAITALTPVDGGLDKLLDTANSSRRKTAASTSSGTTTAVEAKIDNKEATAQLLEIWRSLLKAVILQNSDRGQGEVAYKTTERLIDKESSDHLGSLASNEVATISTLTKQKIESLVAFATRLQEKDRFLQWIASSLLGASEKDQILRYADTVLFETLRKFLPIESSWMSNQRDVKTFDSLSMLVIKVYSKQTDEQSENAAPKPGAFVNLKGGLSRKKGTLVESEEKTEEHNKRVVTRYKPGEPTPSSDSEEDRDEIDEEVVHKISKPNCEFDAEVL